MKAKFWVYYLGIVTVLSGLAYFAIATVPDLPLTLSDEDMDALQGTTYHDNHKCKRNVPGCKKINCENSIVKRGFPHSRCMRKTGKRCNVNNNIQVACKSIYYYDSKCQERNYVVYENIPNCGTVDIPGEDECSIGTSTDTAECSTDTATVTAECSADTF